MPKQTRKKRTGGVPARVVPKAPPVKLPKKKPRFKAAPPPRAPQTVTRLRCPLCSMMTEYKNFLEASPELQFFEQTFGGRLPAPRGTKPGHKSKEAPGVMDYRDITDPRSEQYKNVVDVIRVRVDNINESLLSGQVEEKTKVKRKQSKKKTT
ncbi:MAG: hypothetical protein PHO67_07985 [Candidatus Omnitrophica bacterium]|nr:hypothetical protein [Candidatus Omnitrophota bacterium]